MVFDYLSLTFGQRYDIKVASDELLVMRIWFIYYRFLMLQEVQKSFDEITTRE